jgi:formylglycine-generating enzyme required for sulfatase activity
MKMNKLVTVGLLSVGLWLTGCSQPLEGIIGKKDFVKAVTGVSLDRATLDLYVVDPAGIYNTETLTATVAPGNATNKNVTWTSSDENVATVSDGQVTAVALGTANISVTTEDGNKTATCYVTVNSFVDVTGVSLDKATLLVAESDTRTLIAKIAPDNATNQKVTWASSDEDVARVSETGEVTAVASGVANITVTTMNSGETATCNVTVLSHTELALATPNADDLVTIEGSSAYSFDNHHNVHYQGVFIHGRTVTLSPFRIAKHETTYELWYKVRDWADDNGYTFANAGREGNDGIIGDPPTTAKTEPVTMINWRDAVIWCNAYSEMSGKETVYYTDTSYNTVLKISTDESGTNTAADGAVMKDGANGYRLPTEAEWEYAARGGGTPDPDGPFANKWAGTDTEGDLENYAWYDANSVSATHPVGERTGNGDIGLKDMSGNVLEWCWDWGYSAFGPGPVTDPTGLDSGLRRVVRGGSWFESASVCSVTYRGSLWPDYEFNYMGFRVVCRD